MNRLVLAILAVASVLISGCDKQTPRPAAARPRIVSFAPSITQMLFHMGLGDNVVGVTSQCDVPPGRDLPVVGDVLSVNVEAIVAAKPDVLLVQMDPARFKGVVETAPHIRIEHFRIETLAEIAAAMERIGTIAGRADLGEAARDNFTAALDDVRKTVADRPPKRVMFVYGFQRTSTAGGGTFIDDMITLGGGVNVAALKYQGWKNVSLEHILTAAPEVLICQSDHSRAAEAMKFWAAQEDLPAAREGHIHIVTDRRWTIPSPYSAVLVRQLAEMIHGESLPKGPAE